MTREKILVVGGYGEVGSKIAKLLMQSYPNRVWIAGRDSQKAKQFCVQQNHLVSPMQLDVSMPVKPKQLKNIALVIMCLEQQDTAFAELCLSEGIMYIDITASHAFLKKLELLHPVAVQHQSTAVMSVGMAPGLTNLMAMYVAQQLPSITKLHISILLGAGDKHGNAAIHWILDQLNKQYTIKNHTETKITNFTNKRFVHFNKIGNRSVYQFNFSDQHTLSKHFPQGQIATRMGFDVEWLNRFVSFLQKSRLSNMLKINKVQHILTSLIQKVKIGSSVCAIKVEAIEKNTPSISLSFVDNDESLVTAKIAAAVATELLEKEHPLGTYHIEELFKLNAFIDQFNDSSFI
ncbi:saccharopine dehydrogenase NADP-binding domain-containing protein [Lysinibacillus sp. NPDC093712]|uniref:saccharopine dehydrogenase family protein n=1 Tax=Lysinibacillus sp. NPDC093712 TaxID=3390579 RepID=UPI003D03C545